MRYSESGFLNNFKQRILIRREQWINGLFNFLVEITTPKIFVIQIYCQPNFLEGV